MFPELIPCQLCYNKSFLTFKDKNEKHYCSFCCKEIFIINDLLRIIINLDEKYCFCKYCNILFKYNINNVHHNLYLTGKLFFSDIIYKYYLNNILFNDMPIFYNLDICVSLINNNNIKLYWKNFIKEEECCICFEKTTNSTDCNHFICYTCSNQISVCPICRKEQIYNTIEK